MNGPSPKSTNGSKYGAWRWLPASLRPAPEITLVLARALRERRLFAIYLALTTLGSTLAAGKFLLLERLVNAATADVSRVGLWLAGTISVWLAGEGVLLAASLCGLRLERRVSVALVREALAGLLDPASSDEAACRPETAVHLVRAGVKQAGQSLRALLTSITQGLLLLGMLLAAVKLSPPLAAICVAALLVAVFRTRRHLSEQRQGAREAFRSEQQLHAGLYQLFQALPQVRLVGASAPYAQGLMEVVSARKRGERRLLAGQRRIGLDVQLLSALCSLGLLLGGGALARWGEMPLATLAALLLVQRSMLASCRQALLQWTLAHQPCEVVAALLQPALQAELRHRGGAPSPPVLQLTFEEAKTPWAAAESAPWSLILAPGRLYGVTSRTKGAAARYLAWLASGAAPTTGRLLLGDQPIEQIDRASFRSRVLLGSWPPLIEDGTLAENLRMAAQVPDAKLIEALRRAGLAYDFEQWVPLGGLNAPLGPRGLRLSYGQQQRLIVARAWLRRADVTLLDDPLRGLDAEAIQRVVETLQTMARDSIVVLATSEPTAWEHCGALWSSTADGGLEAAVFNGRKLLPASAMAA